MPKKEINIPKGAGGHGPLTIDELCDTISKANGGAKVEFKGVKPINDAEYVTKSAKQLEKDRNMTMRISKQLKDVLEKKYTDKVKKDLFETTSTFEDSTAFGIMTAKPQPFERKVDVLVEHKGVVVALANDRTLWMLEKNQWQRMDEMIYPGLPQPGQ